MINPKSHVRNAKLNPISGFNASLPSNAPRHSDFSLGLRVTIMMLLKSVISDAE
jgi:hypothetical protein